MLEKDDLVCRFQHVVGVPLENTILHSASTNGIITVRDVTLAAEILGSSIFSTKGNATRSQLDAVDVTWQEIDAPNAVR